jgi:integrase/recombinase XerD
MHNIILVNVAAMKRELVDYLQSIRFTCAQTTYNDKRYQLERFINYLEHNQIHILSVSKDTIEQYLLSRVNCNQQSKRKIWSVLVAFYESCAVPVNPAALVTIKAPNVERLYTIPSKETIYTLIGAMNKGKNAFFTLRNRLLVELAYGSGLRLCELHRATIADVNLLEKTITVLGKGSRMRIVPLTNAVIIIIKEYLSLCKASRGPLFVTASGRRLGSLAISVVFRKYTGRSPHLFRHACATHMLQNGCNTRYIQELLGHKSLTTTQVYTHFDKKTLQSVINKLHPRAQDAPKSPEKPGTVL